MGKWTGNALAAYIVNVRLSAYRLRAAGNAAVPSSCEESTAVVYICSLQYNDDTIHVYASNGSVR